MSALLKVWLFVLTGAAIGVVLSRDTGYVLLSFGNYTVEMSLALLLMLIALLFGLLYFAIRLIARTLHLPQDVRDWKQRRGSRLAQQAMTRGLLEMSEGNWGSAEKRLVRFADRSETPLLNYLAAARAAQLQGAHDRRDGYIRLAHDAMPSADVAVSLTQAELQLADHQLEQALATLKHLRSVAPKHNYVLRLLRRLYEQLGDWEHLRELLPELRRRKVEDDADLASTLGLALEREGYEIVSYPTGREGLVGILGNPPDLVLLDLMLPGIDGLEVTKRLKKSPKTERVPIVMLSAKGEEADIVTGLELGADDYIAKPFSPRIMVARVRTALRRKSSKTQDDKTTVHIFELEIHPGRRSVLAAGKPVDLTFTEFQVLYLLAQRPGWVFTRSMIVDAVRGDDYPVTDRSVDVQIVGLRKKLGDCGKYIETVRGVGYRMKEIL